MGGRKPCYLDTDVPPEYITCDLRRFFAGESHLMRKSDYDVLIVMQAGELVFYEDGQRVRLQAGEWYIQRAGLLQEGRECSDRPLYYYVHFRGTYTFSPENALPLRGQVEPGEVSGLLENLCAVDRSQTGNRTDCLALFYSVLSRLRRIRGEADSMYESARRIERYILEHYTGAITLRHLADTFQYTEDHIIRLFRRKLGVTPHQYLSQLRYGHACRLLLTTDRTLEQVAEATGFADVSTLYRVFVRRSGVSPGSWRRMHRYQDSRDTDHGEGGTQ